MKSEPTRVAMIVPNECNPDFRVVKQAEALVKSGRVVRLFCIKQPNSDLPDFEIINGVEYVRKEWSAVNVLKKYILSMLFWKSGK